MPHALLGTIVTSLGLTSMALAVEPPAGEGSAASKTGNAPAALLAVADSDWTIKRVGGDKAAEARYDAKRGWLFDTMRIETPLPVGYPAPTPPGAVDLKRYPSVRRAEVSDKGAPSSSGGSGFWPLFRHIQRSNIEMTSPVEMDYAGMAEKGAKDGQIDSWTMSFLYRTPELRETGTDPKGSKPVTIRDTAPVTVVSLGVRGASDMDTLRTHFATLEAWLKDNPQWERAGEYRALMYNGPDTRVSRRWSEVQIPVRPRQAGDASASAPK